MWCRRAALVLGALALAGCGGGDTSTSADQPAAAPATIRLQSPQFADGAAIPRALSCEGGGASPALRWTGVPDRTRELALLVDDPDAPNGGFRHWTLWHLSPDSAGIPAGHAPIGSRTAHNDAGTDGWTPPCPPKGDSPHHYVFTLVALKEPLGEADGADASITRKDIAARALATGKLTGRFGR